MKITYENAAEEITLEEAIKFYENGIAVVINDGKDVTFEIETVSTSEEKRKLTKVSNYKISQPHCITDAVRCQEREWQNGNLLGLYI